MLDILQSFHSIPTFSSAPSAPSAPSVRNALPVEPVSPVAPIAPLVSRYNLRVFEAEDEAAQASLRSSASVNNDRMPSSPPPLVRTQPSGLLGQMIRQTLNDYIQSRQTEMWQMTREVVSRFWGVNDDDYNYDMDNIDDELIIEINLLVNEERDEQRVTNRPFEMADLRRCGSLVEMDKMIDEDSKECSICFDAFDEENPHFKTECNHSFHPRCLHTWLNRKHNCPICRHLFAQTR